MSLGVVSPIRNKGLYSDWLSAAPLATSMLTIDTSGNVGSQSIPVAAWGSITGTLSSQTDLQNALDAKLSLSGGTMTGNLLFSSATSSVVIGNYRLLLDTNSIGMRVSAAITWSSASTSYTPVDLAIWRDAAGELGIRNSTNAQRVNLYGTYTDASNYRRLYVSSTTAGAFTLGVEGAGTGASGNTLTVNATSLTSASGTFNNSDSSNTGIIVQPWIQVRNNSNTLTGYVSNGGSIFTSGASGSTDFGLRSIGAFGISTNNSVSPTIVVSTAGTTTLTPASLTGSSATSALDIAQTWNTTGTPTALKLNITDTASNAASLLMDLQVGGSSKFKVQKNGVSTFATASNDVPVIAKYQSGTLNLGYYSSSNTESFIYDYSNGTQLLLGSRGKFQLSVSADNGGSNQRVTLAGSCFLGWASNDNNDTSDVVLRRDAADTLAQRRTTNAQTFRIYNTFTDTSNYERAKIAWSSNVLQIGTEKAGTGSARALELQTDGTTRLTIASGGAATFSGDTTVGNLILSDISGSHIRWSGGSRIYCGADGRIALYQGDLSGFGRLQFGGTTSSFPAIKRNSAGLEVRLADDSGFATIKGKITTDTNYTAGAPTATGYIVLYDAAGTAYKIPAEAL